MRPAVLWAKAEAATSNSVKAPMIHLEAAVRMLGDEGALIERDSIGRTPLHFWSDSHTTIGETVSSTFKSWMEAEKGYTAPVRKGSS
jgi:hypothetical protein